MKVIIALTMCFFLVADISLAQKKNSIKRNTAKPTRQNSNDIIDPPFNTEVKTLPPRFNGHNALHVYWWLVPLLEESKCDKFEKTKDCDARLAKLEERELWKGFKANDLLAFSIPINCSYNPDTEIAKCPESYLFFPPFFIWLHKLTKSTNYVGQNAFGVKKYIQYTEFENINISPLEEVRDLTEFEIQLSPDQAKKILSDLRLLVIGIPAHPWIRKGFAENKPTFDNPSHVLEINKNIVIDLKNTWLYEYSTGRIIDKYATLK